MIVHDPQARGCAGDDQGEQAVGRILALQVVGTDHQRVVAAQRPDLEQVEAQAAPGLRGGITALVGREQVLAAADQTGAADEGHLPGLQVGRDEAFEVAAVPALGLRGEQGLDFGARDLGRRTGGEEQRERGGGARAQWMTSIEASVVLAGPPLPPNTTSRPSGVT